MLAWSSLTVSAAVFHRGGFVKSPFGDGVQHISGRRLALRVRRCRGGKQRVDIDPARGELAHRLGVGAEIERELALHHLRAALGVDGNLEGRKLGMVRRRLELALELEGWKDWLRRRAPARRMLRAIGRRLCRLLCLALLGAAASAGRVEAMRMMMAPS